MKKRSAVAKQTVGRVGDDKAPWRPVGEAVVDGTVCDLKFRDRFGDYEVSWCFLHDDGHWYLVEPPTQIVIKPIAWRPSVSARQGQNACR